MGDVRRCASCAAEIPADAPGGACPRCALAAALPPPSGEPTPEDVAAKLPAFDILGVLGRGGMGVVFRARQKALDRVVALKVLPPATAKAPGFAERFVREAKAMARLQHPNIVAVHDFGVGDGLSWLSMEFVDGMNMREAMARGRVTPKEALAIVPQICDALQYAHDRGVVHRDIKPENVLIDRDGRVRIADFGLAKLADREAGDPSLTGASQVMGTLHYMAPEQWERPKDVDHRCDIYSLGVVFYEMLTGELPVGRFEPPSRRAAIDVRVDEVVMRSLERNREQRWQRADEVKTKVTAITSSPSGAAPAPPFAAATTLPPALPTPRRVRGPLATAAAFFGLMMTFFFTLGHAYACALVITVLVLGGVGGVIGAFATKDYWHLAWAIPALVGGIWWGRVYLRKEPGAVAAPPPEPSAEPADLWQRSADAMSWWPALLPLFAWMILGAVGFDTGSAWFDRMALLMAKVWIVSFFVLHMARDARVGAARAKSGVGRVLAALVPARISLAPHSSLLVLAAAASAVAGFVVTRLGDTAGALIGLPGVFLVMVVLWMCERRSKAVRAAAAGTRGPVGSPMAIELVAMVAFIAGVVALGWAWLDHGAAAGDANAASAPPPAVDKPAREDRAPWQFDVNYEPGMTVFEDDRQQIWKLWSALQPALGLVAFDDLRPLYPSEDWSRILALPHPTRAKLAKQGALGLPLTPTVYFAVPLSKLSIGRVQFGTAAAEHTFDMHSGKWSDVARYQSALVTATDGTEIVRFALVRDPVAHRWLFAAAQVEVK